MLGVPILRDGRVCGVLAVQNRTQRHYTEEEVEAMLTVAMVLAELIGSGDVLGGDELAQIHGHAAAPRQISGHPLSEGLAQGIAVLHMPRVEITHTIAEDTAKEKERLNEALKTVRLSIDRMLEEDDIGRGEHRDILETYRMFTHDRGWQDRLRAAVDTGLTAEAAVQRVQVDTRARMAEISDPYLRERLQDLEDLANRVLQHLAGRTTTAAAEELPEQAVVVARSIGPAELLDYDRERLVAVVLEEGSRTSHAAIVARAMNIPLIGGVEKATARIDPGDPVIVDSEHGQIFIRPGEDVQAAFSESLAVRAERQAKFAALRNEPAISRDGQRISLNINAGLLVDLPHLDDTGADGIGLYRTELHFMVRSTFPDVEAQTELYTKVLDQAGDRPVVFRTLDVGGDKKLPYIGDEKENNPALGWRAIRIGLDRPNLLRTQLRALLQAAIGRNLHVMFPMVADASEFLAAREIVEKEIARLKASGSDMPRHIHIGTMLEVPALAWQLPAMLDSVDFISVGSNDLIQFLYAVDRENLRVSERYDRLGPSLLALLKHVAESCNAANVPLSLCGEMAGHPIEALALLAIGYRSLSMASPNVGPVKEMVRTVDITAAAQYLDSLLRSSEHSLRNHLHDFARDHGISI
jgi:phosphotransferase system enzyme I (PtsP)